MAPPDARTVRFEPTPLKDARSVGKGVSAGGRSPLFPRASSVALKAKNAVPAPPSDWGWGLSQAVGRLLRVAFKAKKAVPAPPPEVGVLIEVLVDVLGGCCCAHPIAGRAQAKNAVPAPPPEVGASIEILVDV